MDQMIKMSRRGFIKASALAGSGLLLGCSNKARPLVYRSKVSEGASNVSSWLHINNDGIVTMLIPSSEMGQGVSTGLATIIGEELDVNWEKIKIEFAPLAPEYNNPGMPMRFTGASASIKSWWDPLRVTGATAREMLVLAASKKWRVSVSECHTKNGEVIHTSGKKLSYGQLAEDASKIDPPDDPQLKSPSEYKFIGKPIKRLDTPSKVNGTCVFGIDVVLPGMVHATVAQSPVFGGKVKNMNKPAAQSSKGVEAVVDIPNGVAVVADSYWHAKKGLIALAVEFDEGENAQFNDALISQQFRSILNDVGKDSFPDASKTIDIEYETPFLAHAAMEPMNFTAHVKNDSCEVWGPTQAQSVVAKTVEDITGFSSDQIKVHTTFLGGGFGRRVEQDFIKQAVIISKAVKKPVKLVWSREEDIQHDFYRQAAMIRFQIALDDKGTITNWSHQMVTPSLVDHYFPEFAPKAFSWIPVTSLAGDFLVKEGATEDSLPYEIDEVNTDFEIGNTPVPVGFWRSVAHSHNGFFIESAVDEAAHLAGEDPYQYRRRMLKTESGPDDKRYLTVLDLAAEKAGWGKAAPGRFQGIALHKSFDTYVCEVAEIAVTDGELKVYRVVCAVDCGIVINPDTVEAQIESGVVYGLVAAMQGDINIDKGRVRQSNFHDYQILRMAQVPRIEVHIVPSQEPPTGVGEPGTPPIAPAVTNAIFAATGIRIRSLPISKHSLKKV